MNPTPPQPPSAEQPSPGDLYYDETGRISGYYPATYLMLHRNRTDKEPNAPWMAARFHDGYSWRLKWMGASVVPLYPEDVAQLRFVGRLQTRHLWFPCLRRKLAAAWSKTTYWISLWRIQLKYGRRFWENSDYPWN